MFDGIKNLSNLRDLIGKAQEMQTQIQQAQEELKRKTVQAEAGGGMVTAIVNGRMELTVLKIDKSRVDPNDTEMLEDLIVAAVRAAQSKAADMMNDEMRRMTSGMGLPPGMLGQ